MRISLPFALILGLSTATLAAPPNPQIDYPGFERLTRETGPARKGRLISLGEFKQMATSRRNLILDARSKDAFAEGHIAGAINLPLTDFTAESLAQVIGKDNKRAILIYCNNNFSNHKRPVPLKATTLSLNIQTFINLKGYGYHNVWELADIVDFNDPKVGWRGSEQSGHPALLYFNDLDFARL
jgi:phage shock protein E